MRRLRHRWSVPRLDAFVDDELARDACLRIRRHLHECPDCTGTVLLTERLKHALRRAERGRPPDLAVARLRQFAAAIDAS